jgi:hypothetical protein
VSVDHNAAMPGSVTVNGTLTVSSASVTLTINGTLTLNAGGVLNNPGTVRVGAFVNNGGTINGNPPVMLSLGPTLLRIDQLQVMGQSAGATGLHGDVATGRTLVLKWRAAPGDRFVVESSQNLQTWAEDAWTIIETSPGTFEATLPADQAGPRFYRLRRR